MGRIARLGATMAVALALAGCGDGGGRPTPTVSATPTISAAELEAAYAAVTVYDLAALVLQKGAYGLLTVGMDVSPTSGYSDNQDVAVEDLNTLGATRADVDALGRVGGYDLTFELPAFDAGLVQVASSLELFEANRDVERYVELVLEDVARRDGSDGIALARLTEFDIAAVEGGRGFRAELEFTGLGNAVWTGAWVQRGPLLHVVALLDAESLTDRSPDVGELLGQLEARVLDGLTGTIEARVEHRLPEVERRKVPPPAEGPDLAAMALTLADLVRGFELTTDGYFDEPDREAYFERSFTASAALAPLGGSSVDGVSVSLELWSDADEASSFLADRAALFGGVEGPANYQGALAQSGTFITETVAELSEPDLGDGALSLEVSATFGEAGSRTLHHVWIRRGQVVAQLVVTGPAGELLAEDVLRLAELLDARLAS